MSEFLQVGFPPIEFSSLQQLSKLMCECGNELAVGIVKKHFKQVHDKKLQNTEEILGMILGKLEVVGFTDDFRIGQSVIPINKIEFDEFEGMYKCSWKDCNFKTAMMDKASKHSRIHKDQADVTMVFGKVIRGSPAEVSNAQKEKIGKHKSYCTFFRDAALSGERSCSYDRSRSYDRSHSYDKSRSLSKSRSRSRSKSPSCSKTHSGKKGQRLFSKDLSPDHITHIPNILNIPNIPNIPKILKTG